MSDEPNTRAGHGIANLLGFILMVSGLLACIFAPDSSIEVIVSRAAMVGLGYLFVQIGNGLRG